jgi:hypothetical protein
MRGGFNAAGAAEDAMDDEPSHEEINQRRGPVVLEFGAEW